MMWWAALCSVLCFCVGWGEQSVVWCFGLCDVVLVLCYVLHCVVFCGV